MEIFDYKGFVVSEYTLLQMKKKLWFHRVRIYSTANENKSFVIDTNNFLCEKLQTSFSILFFNLPPKFSDFINSDDFIGQITSKSIRLYPVFIKKERI